MSQIHEFNMDMTCDGCVNAAKKVLAKLGNIENVDASYETKTVNVTTTLGYDEVLKALQKTGKVITYVGSKSA